MLREGFVNAFKRIHPHPIPQAAPVRVTPAVVALRLDWASSNPQPCTVVDRQIAWARRKYTL